MSQLAIIIRNHFSDSFGRWWFALSLIFLVGGLVAVDAVEPRILVWKFDDLKLAPRSASVSGISNRFVEVVAWAQKTKTPISMGIITKTLADPRAGDVAWIKTHAVENGGLVEFWHHGWDHSRPPSTEGKTEFQGTIRERQVEHLRQGIDAMKQVTGLTITTFGAPNNGVDANTVLALDACPEITVWLYGLAGGTNRTVLPRSANLEYEVGKIDYQRFVQAYKTRRAEPVLVLQGHPPMWDDASMQAFQRIAAFLTTEGWVARIPRACR